jgi:hypothetical protein
MLFNMSPPPLELMAEQVMFKLEIQDLLELMARLVGAVLEDLYLQTLVQVRLVQLILAEPGEALVAITLQMALMDLLVLLMGVQVEMQELILQMPLEPLEEEQEIQGELKALMAAQDQVTMELPLLVEI